jgi:Flp pilus assembly protein TadD
MSPPKPPSSPADNNQPPGRTLEDLRRELLKPYLHDPEISRALDGDPHRLYRVLEQKKKSLPPPDQLALDSMLADRRLFGRPVKNPPTMYTVNGIGTRLYGKTHPHPDDGTQISTLFFTLVFLPVFPMKQYLVLPAGNGSWYFLSEVPSSRGVKSWRLASVLLTLCVILGIAGAIAYDSHYAAIRVANGFEAPLHVTIDQEQPVKVRPHHISLIPPIARGPHEIVVRTEEGDFVDEAKLTVSTGTMVYNIQGAAPIYVQPIHYYRDGTIPPVTNRDTSAVQDYCGQKWIAHASVDYPFYDPPRQISMSKHSTKSTRWHMAVADGGWRTTVDTLIGKNKLKDAAAISATAARLEPDNENAIGLTFYLWKQSQDEAAAMNWLRQFITAHPRSLAAHRVYQTMMERADQSDAARAEYRQRQADAPDSALFAYLAIRMEPPEVALQGYQDLVTQHPQDPMIRRGYAWTLFQLGRFEDANQQYNTLAQSSQSTSIDDWLSLYARSLIAAGRVTDAAQLVRQRCTHHVHAGTFDSDLAVLCSKMDTVAPANDHAHSLDGHLKRLNPAHEPSADTILWFSSRINPAKIDPSLFHSATNEIIRAAAEVERDTPVNAKAALTLTREKLMDHLDWVADDTRLLLASAAALENDKVLVDKLVNHLTTVNHPQAVVRFLLTGQRSPLLDRLDVSVRAALAVHEARMGMDNPATVEAACKRAIAGDILPGQVARAVHHLQSK